MVCRQDVQHLEVMYSNWISSVVVVDAVFRTIFYAVLGQDTTVVFPFAFAFPVGYTPDFGLKNASTTAHKKMHKYCICKSSPMDKKNNKRGYSI